MPKKNSNQALEELMSINPGAPVPGTGVGSNCLNGRYATATWGGAGGLFVIKLYEWEVNYTQDFEDGTAHGDFWDVPIPSKMSWTGEARSYISAIDPNGAAGSGNWRTFMNTNSGLYNAGRVSADPAVATFTGYLTGTASANFLVWQGSCYVSRAQLASPRKGMVTQQISLRGYGPPTFGPLGT
jgi:hypothetical protein